MATLLVHGLAVEVDDARARDVGAIDWAVYVNRNGKPYFNSRGRYLHRYLLEQSGGALVDHRDGDTLNNRLSNLRLCTPQQNKANSVKPRGDCWSKFKGVCWVPPKQRWVAQIQVTRDGRRVYAFRRWFRDEVDAAVAYDHAARLEFGEFACLNFPLVGERSCLTGEVVHG